MGNIKWYCERFSKYVDINEVLEEKRLKLFLNVLGPQAYEQLKKDSRTRHSYGKTGKTTS